jgi:polyisoprenoid-binding protein YceI
VTKGPGFDMATLSDIDLKGLNPEVPEGKGFFTGVLKLHGVTNTVTGAVDVRQAGAALRVKASFPLNLADYSIRQPRYLGVGVKDTITVEVAFAVTR